MSRSIEHSSEFEYPVDQVFSTITEEESLQQRLDHIGGKDAALLEHAKSASTTSYTLRQGIPADKLPGAIRNLHKGDLIVQREQTWELASDGTATGKAKASVAGVPGAIEAHSKLTATGDGTRMAVRGEVTVNIPLIGGKIEQTIADQVVKLLAREDAYVADQLAGKS